MRILGLAGLIALEIVACNVVISTGETDPPTLGSVPNDAGAEMTNILDVSADVADTTNDNVIPDDSGLSHDSCLNMCILHNVNGGCQDQELICAASWES